MIRCYSSRALLTQDMHKQSGEGVIILDAGGGTVDLSAYYMKEADQFEEIAPATCT